MDKDDIDRFHRIMEKHLNKNFSKEEKSEIEARRLKAKRTAERIIKNSGGKNPLLGY